MGQLNWKTYLALVLPVLLVYSPALELGWIWDDDQYVYQNPTLLSVDGLRSIWFEPGATPQYYPLVFSTFWLLQQLFGNEPFAYHVVNIALHAVNAVLCLRILHQLRVLYPFWIALAFGLHPIQVESVAWVTELKNVLSGTMYGLAWLYLFPLLGNSATSASDSATRVGDSATKDMAGQRRPSGWLWLPGLLFFVGALLSKSVTASLPAAMLVAIWFQAGRISRRQALLSAPLLLLGGFFGWNTARLEVEFVGAQGDEFQHDLMARTGIAARSIVHYSLNALAPAEQMFFYPRYRPDAWQAAGVAVVIVAAIVLLGLYLSKKGKRGMLAAFLFFAGSAFPALGFLNVYPHRYSFVADHFVYLPVVGLLAVVVSGMIAVASWLRNRWSPQSQPLLNYAMVSMWLMYIALGTVRHLPNFADEITLWEDTLRKNPSSAIAMHNLAMRYNESGRSSEALPLIERALEFNVDRFQMLNTLGVIHSSLGNGESAAEAFRRSIELFPDNALAVHNLAKTLQADDSFEAMSPEAIAMLGRAHELYVKSYAAQPKFDHALGAGVTAVDLHRADDARRWLETALRSRPDDLSAQLDLARALILAGDFVQARKIALRVVEALPDNQAAREVLSDAESRLAP